jgi:hypothetical protein
VTLSTADQALIDDFAKQWKAAQASGNTKGMEDAHNAAEAVRAQNGYSGGADGSQFIPIEKTLPSAGLYTPTPTPLPYEPGSSNGLTTLPYYPTDKPQVVQYASAPADAQNAGTTPTSHYMPQGIYNDAGMSADDKAKIESLQYQWKLATEAGDIVTAGKLHEDAEAIRAKYGYSGGGDGSQYTPLDLSGQPTDPAIATPPPNNPGGYYTPPVIPSATSGEQYIKDYYAALQESIEQAYKTAYDANMNTLDAAAAKIPAQYQAARNQTAAQSEIQRANFNEYASATGLNSGAGGQAVLAMGNQLQSNLSGISAAEADALSNLELQRTQLATQYQNDIAQAIKDGKMEEANALYGEYVRIDNSIVDRAVAQASLNASAYDMNNSQYNTNRDYTLQAAYYTGDFSRMAAYGWPPSLIAAARQQWLENKNR